MCHEPARKEEKRTPTQRDESIRRDMDILWKTFALSSGCPPEAPIIDENFQKRLVPFAIHSQALL
jgi:hypothetical protein